MAGQVNLCLAFLLVLHVSLVSCRHDYYHYFSKYVTGESSTELSSSSTAGISTGKSTDISIPGISTSKSPDISMPGLHYSENVISPKDNSYSSSNNDVYERSPTNTVIQSSSYNENDMRTILMVRWGLTVGGIIAVGLIVCCVALCCPCCCKGKERRGFIVSNNIPEQPRVNLMQPQIQQPVAVQHFPPETQDPQKPPPYDTQPIQQQFQYPSTEHLLHENPIQPVGQQLYQQPLVPQAGQQLYQQPLVPQAGQQLYQQPLAPPGYSNPETVPPPYPTKY